MDRAEEEQLQKLSRPQDLQRVGRPHNEVQLGSWWDFLSPGIHMTMAVLTSWEKAARWKASMFLFGVQKRVLGVTGFYRP